MPGTSQQTRRSTTTSSPTGSRSPIRCSRATSDADGAGSRRRTTAPCWRSPPATPPMPGAGPARAGHRSRWRSTRSPDPPMRVWTRSTLTRFDAASPTTCCAQRSGATTCRRSWSSGRGHWSHRRSRGRRCCGPRSAVTSAPRSGTASRTGVVRTAEPTPTSSVPGYVGHDRRSRSWWTRPGRWTSSCCRLPCPRSTGCCTVRASLRSTWWSATTKQHGPSGSDGWQTCTCPAVGGPTWGSASLRQPPCVRPRR